MTVSGLIGAGVLVLFIVPIMQKLLTSEVEGWLPHLSEKVVRAAAQRLLCSERDRYVDEWLAELAEFHDRRLTGLLWALDLYRGSRALGRELTSRHAPVVASSARPSRIARAKVDGRFSVATFLVGPGTHDIGPEVLLSAVVISVVGALLLISAVVVAVIVVGVGTVAVSLLALRAIVVLVRWRSARRRSQPAIL